MKFSVDILFLGSKPSSVEEGWGNIYAADPSPKALAAFLESHVAKTQAEALLFWDTRFPLPKLEFMEALLEQPVEVWHAGLKLGLRGEPQVLDYVMPTWMLNRDPEPDQEATSWRLSFQACLIRTEVLKQMKGPVSDFESLEMAGLEMGHRYIQNGVFMRYIPGLIPNIEPSPLKEIFEEEVRFLHHRFSALWKKWAVMRSVLSGKVFLFKALKALGKVRKVKRVAATVFKRPQVSLQVVESYPSVSVLIPTLNRYAFLKKLLGQLQKQTVLPLEVILVDQTEFSQRDSNILSGFSKLSIQHYFLDQPGQCSSRNLGLHKAKGEYVLFLDDDDEIEAHFIEKHLKEVCRYKHEVSSGVALEDGIQKLPDDFCYERISDVFPTNNTLIQKKFLFHSGLFDLAYDRKQRADADLGMRFYLSGALMVLNPQISVIHHHAKQGGLRTHKARVVTYGASRNSLWVRHIPSSSEIYLAMRYFQPQQVREFLLQRLFGTFSIRGGMLRKGMKGALGFLCLPHTFWMISKNKNKAKKMLEQFPKIPSFENDA